MIKIAITGPESSGKTTLSKELADHFQVKWFAEYAREYLTKTKGKYTELDLLNIAQKQNYLRSKNDYTDNILIFDTENTVIKVWSEFKYNQVSPEIVKLQENQRFDHYFLCSPSDIEWEEDPLRENPEEREALFLIYKNELKQLGVPFTILKGSLEKRLNDAIELVEDLSLSGGGFCV